MNCRSIVMLTSPSIWTAVPSSSVTSTRPLDGSPSPPVVQAVVDVTGGGRFTCEVADAEPERIHVGSTVGFTFRRLFTAGHVHNYFWKARPTRAAG